MKENKLLYEKELFRRIAKGDEDAFRKIFETYTPRLVIYVRSMVKSNMIAEEIVQDVFLKIWKGRHKLVEIENPNRWLFIVTRNRILDHFRILSRDIRLQKVIWQNIQEDRNETEEKVDENSSRRLIAQALDQLSSHKQRIFQLSRYEGLTHEEIGLEMGIAKNTVKNHLVETLRFIRDYLNTHGDPIVALIILHFLKNH